jgi:hypothetical protein
VIYASLTGSMTRWAEAYRWKESSCGWETKAGRREVYLLITIATVKSFVETPRYLAGAVACCAIRDLELLSIALDRVSYLIGRADGCITPT